MNQDMLLLAVAGITIGLLVVVLAAARTSTPPPAGVLRRGAMAGLLVYALVAAPVFLRGGMTLVGLVLLLVVLALPLVALVVAERRRAGRPKRW